MKKSLHLVSFDVPFPPNYGGVIDVFYKIKELHKLGVSIFLHTFLYDDKTEQKELEKYCEKVFYYQRKKNIRSLFSKTPFIVKTRKNDELVKNLNAIKAPILFEGLHTMAVLSTEDLDVKTYVRTHNIEHKYFYGLAKSESNIFKKSFFYSESWKLKHFEKQLSKANGIFTISPHEQNYFSSVFEKKCIYIPAFHQTKTIENHTDKGHFILYHGDLRVSDNVKAALFLIDVYKNTNYNFVVASSSKEKTVIEQINKHKNIEFTDIPNQEFLEELFSKAHINTLLTYQKTGIKLKLLNALYQGKFIIANDKMIKDTGLETLCKLANTKEDILVKTKQLFKLDFTKNEVEKRQEKLIAFNPIESAKKIISIIFKQ